MATWLDSVLATPLFGLRLRPCFETAVAYPDLLAGFLDDLLARGAVNLTPRQPFGLQIFTPGNGNRMNLEVNNLVASSGFTLEGKAAPGELPAFEDIDPRPFSEVASELIALLAETADAMAKGGRPLECDRFGIMARASMATDAIPPGVQKLKDKLVGSWTKRIPKLDSTVLVVLSESDERLEQCHHRLSFDETQQKGQIELTLDWQRVPREPVRLDEKVAREQTESAFDAAVAYFEMVADGGFDDA